MSLTKEQALTRLASSSISDHIRLGLTDPDSPLFPEFPHEQRIAFANRLSPIIDQIQILQESAINRGGSLALEVADLYPQELRGGSINDPKKAQEFIERLKPDDSVLLGIRFARLTDIHGFEPTPANIGRIISYGEERTKRFRKILEVSEAETQYASILEDPFSLNGQRETIIKDLEAAGFTNEKPILLSADQIIEDRVPPSNWSRERCLKKFEKQKTPVVKIQKLLDSWHPQGAREFAIGLLTKIDPETKTDIAIELKNDIAVLQPDWQSIIPEFCQALGISSLEFLLIASFLRKNPIFGDKHYFIKRGSSLYQRIIDEAGQLRSLGDNQITRLSHLLMRDACTELHVVPNNSNQELITAADEKTQQGISEIIKGYVYQTCKYDNLKDEAPALLKSGQEKIKEGRKELNNSNGKQRNMFFSFIPFLDLANI